MLVKYTSGHICKVISEWVNPFTSTKNKALELSRHGEGGAQLEESASLKNMS